MEYDCYVTLYHKGTPDLETVRESRCCSLEVAKALCGLAGNELHGEEPKVVQARLVIVIDDKIV